MDWQRFLDENNIHYVSRGPNTKRGEVSIQCPMCGEEDPSEHLGINLQNGKWGCHRDVNHRGKSPRTLIKAILGCSSPQAGFIVKQYSHSDPDSLEAALAVLEADNKGTIEHDEDIAKQARLQQAGPQFRDFNHIKKRGITQRFFEYLQNRGYEHPQDVIKRYDLRCALTGKYKDRIIIPIKHNDELLGWTSRALGKLLNAPRYLASSEDIKAFIFNYDQLKYGGDRLFITEGPFDAIRVDNHNFDCKDLLHKEIRATCTFGTSVTISQIALLRALKKNFNETWILFDHGAEKPANDLAEWIGAKVANLPDGYDDPGELDNENLDYLTTRMFQGWWGVSGLARLIQKTGNSVPKGIARDNAWWRRSSHKP